MNGYFLAIHGNDVKIFDSGDKYMYKPVCSLERCFKHTNQYFELRRTLCKNSFANIAYLNI